MTAPIDIANRALAQIKAGKTIARFDENSVEADACGRFYETARDTALAAYGWAFARHYASLARLPQSPAPSWPYAYRYPADCLKVHKLHAGVDLPEHFLHGLKRYQVASDEDGQIILTNMPRPVLEYTARIESPDAWSAPFQQVVVFLLASYIAIPITGSQQLATANLQYYQQQLEAGEVHSAQESREPSEHVRSSVEARW